MKAFPGPHGLKKSGSKEFNKLREEGSEHQIEETGKKLRNMMSWMQDSKLVDEKITTLIRTENINAKLFKS